MRKLININDSWKFSREDQADAYKTDVKTKKWEDVSVPHTWNAIDGANGFDYYQGACWYRKKVFLPVIDKG